MAKTTIPVEIQEEAIRIIDLYNQEEFGDEIEDLSYVPEFKGKFLYLKRKEFGNISPVARLTYTGKMTEWEFTIFKWSTERYDPDEWSFPGTEYIDGTIEGALEAGMEAYPV